VKSLESGTREKTERASPFINEAVGRNEDSFSFLAPVEMKMDPYYYTDDKLSLFYQVAGN